MKDEEGKRSHEHFGAYLRILRALLTNAQGTQDHEQIRDAWTLLTKLEDEFTGDQKWQG